MPWMTLNPPKSRAQISTQRCLSRWTPTAEEIFTLDPGRHHHCRLEVMGTTQRTVASGHSPGRRQEAVVAARATTVMETQVMVEMDSQQHMETRKATWWRGSCPPSCLLWLSPWSVQASATSSQAGEAAACARANQKLCNFSKLRSRPNPDPWTSGVNTPRHSPRHHPSHHLHHSPCHYPCHSPRHHPHHSPRSSLLLFCCHRFSPQLESPLFFSKL